MTETPRLGHEPIRMRYVGPQPPTESLSMYAGAGLLSQRGDFFWDLRGGKRSLVVALPIVPRTFRDDPKDWEWSRWTIDHPNHCDAQWSWDGNEMEPTLSPSLHAVGLWHGWVRGGMLVEA